MMENMNKKVELNKEELEQVAGGINGKERYIIYDCKYTCPECGSCHTFKMRDNTGVRLVDVKYVISEFNPPCRNLYLARNQIFSYDGNKIKLYSQNGTIDVGFTITSSELAYE